MSSLPAVDQRRAHWYHAVLAAGLLTVTGTAALLQVGQRDHYLLLSEHNRVQAEIIPARRGSIVDRYGRLLARDRTVLNAVLDPGRVAGAQQRLVLARLAGLAGVPVEKLRARQAHLRRQLRPFQPQPLLTELSEQQLIRIETRSGELPGISIVPALQREYPHGTTAAHLLGYMNELTWEEYRAGRELGYQLGDRRGRTGMEAAAEEWLRGSDGCRWLEVDARQRPVRVLPHPLPLAAVDGARVHLTIDAHLQQAAENAFPPDRRGAVVALDPENGAVRVLVSRPAFDPNAFARGDVAAIHAALTEPSSPLLNRAIAGQYPAGSTFKVIDALAALTGGQFTPETRFTCNGALALGTTVFRCWHSGHGSLPLVDALRQSCNVYFYQLGVRLGPETIAATARALGLGARTGIPLPGEEPGLVPDPAWKAAVARRFGLDPAWKAGDSANLAIGQGALLVTPLQLAVAFAAVANGGRVLRPLLLERIVHADGRVVRQLQAEPLRQVPFAPATLAAVRAGLQQAVSAGTARSAAVFTDGTALDELPAGKTGTAQVGDRNRNNRVDPGEEPHAWFVAWWPAQQPQLVVAVFVENGGYGGTAAAPVARQIFAALERPGTGDD